MNKTLAKLSKLGTYLFCTIWITSFGLAQSETKTTNSSPPAVSYPSIYYRGPEYAGMHCIRGPRTNPVSELYLLRMVLRDLQKGVKKETDVAEFFSGRRYKAQVVNKGDFEIDLTIDDKAVTLECEVANMVQYEKSSPINEQGDYLSSENVDVQTGKWGNDVYINNNCDIGTSKEACDIGLQGMSRRRSDGSVVWAKLFVVAAPYPKGHPVWNVPNALNILDGNWDGTWLNDGSAIFTISSRGWSGPTVRVNMKDGTLFDTPQDVALVSLDDWAQLKHILKKRWVGDVHGDLCKFLQGERRAMCQRDVTRMYFYTQQSYLFPMLSSKPAK